MSYELGAESGIACGDDFCNAVGDPSPGLRPPSSNKEGFTGGGSAAFYKIARSAHLASLPLEEGGANAPDDGTPKAQ